MASKLGIDAEGVGYAVVLRQQLGQHRDISLQFNMPLGATAQTWAQELDTLNAVLDRQLAKLTIPALEDDIRGQELIVRHADEEISKLNALKIEKERVNPELRSQKSAAPEVAAMESHKQKKALAQERINTLRKTLDEVKKKAA